MTILPSQLEALDPGLGLVCISCRQRVVEAVHPPEGEPYVCPACTESVPTSEDELTRAAMEDPDAAIRSNEAMDAPTMWRVIFAIALAVVALGVVFWKR